VKAVEKARIRLSTAWTTAWPAHTFRLGRDAQFGQPTSDCATRNAGGAHDRADPATPRRPASGRCETPPPRAFQHRSERLKVLAYDQCQSGQNDVVLRRLREPYRETKSSAIKVLSLSVAPDNRGGLSRHRDALPAAQHLY
jgi:hypothetical protein